MASWILTEHSVEGAGKGEHEPVPEALDLLPARIGHRRPQQAEMGPAEVVRRFVAESIQQLGRSH
jgi:hypothetical protein